MFDLGKVEVNDNSSALKKGWYGGHAEKMEWRTSKAGAEYLNIQWRLDNNNLVFQMLHVFNSSEKARNIALSSVKKMVVAMGGNKDMTISSKEALVEFVSTVNCELYLSVKKQDGYEDKNDVANFRERTEQNTEQSNFTSNDMPF